jgi:hypothetical protein
LKTNPTKFSGIMIKLGYRCTPLATKLVSSTNK